MFRLYTFVAALSIASISFADEVPRVSTAVPEIGSRDVDHGLTEITVTFDREMSTGGFSFVGGGPAFPGTTGQPRWKDGRTSVLPLQLEPGKDYRLSLNSVSFKNFQSADRVPLEPVVFTFRTAGKGTSAPAMQSATTQQESRQRLQHLIQTSYSYRDVRKVDWEERWKTYAPKLDDASTSPEFAEIAGEALAAANDPHIWLVDGDETIPSFIRHVDPNADYRWLEKTIPGFHREGENHGKRDHSSLLKKQGMKNWATFCLLARRGEGR